MEQDSDFFLVDPKWENEKEFTDFHLLNSSDKGWCAVYSCLFQGRRVAIKVLKEEYRENRLYQRLLQKEYSVGVMLSHPYIVQTECIMPTGDYGEGIVMEYVAGETLGSYIKKRGPLKERDIDRIMGQICSALEYIHSRQLVHCDLKPSNILITDEGGFVKLIDFGLSRGVNFERYDIPGGTQGFSAPESENLSAKASISGDIYALGKIIEIMDPKGRLREVVRKCTAISPDNRPGRASDISVLIKKARTRRRLFTRLTIGVIIGLGLVGGGYLSFTDHKKGENALITNDIRNASKEGHIDSISSQDESMTLGEEEREENIPIIPGFEEEAKDSSVLLPVEKSGEKTDRSAETPVEKNLSNVDDNEFRRQFSEKFEAVMTRRYKEHLKFIDTISTYESYRLYTVGHWKWEAAKELEGWLKRVLSPDDYRLKEETGRLKKYIDQWASLRKRQSEIRQHAQKVPQNLINNGVSTEVKGFRSETEYVVKTFGQDGKWHERVIEIPVFHTTDEEAEILRWEYVRKALKELKLTGS